MLVYPQSLLPSKWISFANSRAPSVELRSLPLLSFDTETTGLDVFADSICSIGFAAKTENLEPLLRQLPPRTVHTFSCAGASYVAAEWYVKPHRRPSAVSVRIHGLTKALLADAPTFAEIWPVLAPVVERSFLHAFNTGFDVAMLAQHVIRARLPFCIPLSTDQRFVARICRGIDAQFDEVLSAYDISNRHRHSALGDAEAVLRLWLHELDELSARGIHTLHDLDLHVRQTNHHLIQQQANLGWLPPHHR
ncbi:MAG: 3'-5' exonuclease [Actinomycetia bacterium]|nr:3'-5' exonuclease [Actinomycetes bacterium]